MTEPYLITALMVFVSLMTVCVFLSICARADIERSKEFDRLAGSFLNLHFKAIGFKGNATVVDGRASIDRDGSRKTDSNEMMARIAEADG